MAGSSAQYWVSIGLIVLAALLLRLYQIDTLSLWLDEAYGVWFSDQDWNTLWREVPEYEAHPVFYYSVLKIWRIFGSDEFTLRLFSALCSTSAIPFVAGAAWYAAPARDRQFVAIFTALLFALSYVQIQFAQDARPYGMMSLAMAVCMFCSFYIIHYRSRASHSLLKLFKSDRRMALAFLGLTTSITILMWSHNIGLIFVFLLGLCLLTWCLAKGANLALLFNLSLAAVIAILLYLPNLLVVLHQVSATNNKGLWIPSPELNTAISDFQKLSLGMGHFTPLGLFYLVQKSVRSRGLQPSIFVPIILVVLAVGPVIISYCISQTWVPIYLFRTFVPSQIPVLICLSFVPVIMGVWLGVMWRNLIAGLGVVAVATTAALYHQQVADPNTGRQENYRTIMEQAIATAGDEDITILTVPVSSTLPFLYYSRKFDVALNLIYLPEPYPARDPSYTYPAGAGGVPEITSEMLRSLPAKFEGVESIWFVQRRPELFDQYRKTQDLVERTFPCLVVDLPPFAQKRQRAPDGGEC